MTHNQVFFRSAAREKVLKGADDFANAVRVTPGPRSKSALLERKWGKPLVCNDGVTNTKKCSIPDPEENLGAPMIRQAAERTGELVGDGTSTTTVLAHTIVAVELEAAKSEGDTRTGLLILKRAPEAPARQIALNSSVDDGVVVNRMREGKGNSDEDAKS